MAKPKKPEICRQENLAKFKDTYSKARAIACRTPISADSAWECQILLHDAQKFIANVIRTYPPKTGREDV